MIPPQGSFYQTFCYGGRTHTSAIKVNSSIKSKFFSFFHKNKKSNNYDQYQSAFPSSMGEFLLC